MFRRLSAVAAAALIVRAGSQIASATPKVADRAPAGRSASEGSYKVARDTRRARKRRANIRRQLDDIGARMVEGFLALGAVAAAARDNKAFRRDRSCRRVERHCARRHGWEVRRWYRCGENRDCWIN